MTEPLTPVGLESQIIERNASCYRGLELLKAKHTAFLAAETEYEHEKAQAQLAHKSPVVDKRPAAVVATYELKKLLDFARVEFEYTKKKLDVALSELMALQNLNKGVRTAYNAERGFGG